MTDKEKIKAEIKTQLSFIEPKENEYQLGRWTELHHVLTFIDSMDEVEDKGEISDGYHTFNELYYYRMLYNAAFFNLLPKEKVYKSKRHYDGEECFGGGWFIVMANLPTGQISNHYELKDWDLFKIPEKEKADEWDGHTPQEAARRLYEYLTGKLIKIQIENVGEGACSLVKEITEKQYYFLKDLFNELNKNCDLECFSPTLNLKRI